MSKVPGRVALTVLACLLGIIPIPAQTLRTPFSLTIRPEPPAIQTGLNRYEMKPGEKLLIDVHLTNISTHKLALGYDGDSRTGITFEHEYDVRDHDGKLVEKRLVNHPEIGSTGHGWPARILKRGESMDINGDQLGRAYDLNQPGEYTVQLSRAASEKPKGGIVKSNTITVIVTP